MWVRRVARLATLLLLIGKSAHADVDDFLGHPIASIAFESGGRPVTDPRFSGLVETRVGEPLRVADVRRSIAHLFSLGQFDDVRARASGAGSGVALIYEFVPMHAIDDLSIGGSRGPGVDADRFKRLILERFGGWPRPARIDEAAALITEDLRRLGYLHAAVTPSIDSGEGPSHEVLKLTLATGERARIGTIAVDGDPGMPSARFLDELDVARGQPFERERINSRIDKYLDGRRSRGFFNAQVSLVPRLVDDDRTVNLTLTVSQGPHVTVAFRGDPLPAERRDELVPVAREGAADEDLLEDSSHRIEEYLRTLGYRDAAAPHTREEQNGEVVITFTVRRGPLYRVGRVDVSGNNSVPLTDLQARLRIKPGQPFSETALEADRVSVEDLYHRAGFAAVQTQATTESGTAAGVQEIPVAIRLVIDENTRTLVRSVRIEGTRAAPESELKQNVGLQPGQPFSYSQLAIDRDAIQLRLANLGYQSAVVSTNVALSPDGSGADVTFAVREGPQLVVDHILIVGNERTRAATIERELQFKAGEPLGLEKINESQRRLAALGLFRRARITELAHGDPTRRDILVTVEEAPVTTVGYGGGLEGGERLRTEPDGIASERLEIAPRAFFEVGRRNLLGKNRSVNLFTRVSLRNPDSVDPSGAPPATDSGVSFSEYRVLGTFREPRVMGSNADALLTATLDQEIRSSFNFARRAFSAELGRRLTRSVSVSGNYQIQRTRLFDEKIAPEDRITIDRVFPQLRLSSFSGSIVRDTRDDLTDPSTGRFVSANGQIAGRRIGSEVGFAKSYLSAQMFRILPHTDRTVFATSARLGFAAGFPRETIDRDENGDPVLGPDGRPLMVVVRDLPASERFFAGGDTTVRGFALDQLGRPDTIDKDGFPQGGGGLVILNAEVRVPIGRGLGGVGFVDAGNVFAHTSDIDLTALRGAVGFGVRYKSPIGPIRIDLGFKLHRNVVVEGTRESLTALHISLGQAF